LIEADPVFQGIKKRSAQDREKNKGYCTAYAQSGNDFFHVPPFPRRFPATGYFRKSPCRAKAIHVTLNGCKPEE